ncbi:Mediator-associated protein 1 [Morella rubra]|uniref:Mediator-associated protein 1 n=1 Tax=Morella rubra TaxID=262757 RepID=A0A6A1UR08_9ROSI|nr:Mediator-associated protein 1 [Morella rubra]
MASEQDDTVFPEEDLDDDDDELSEEDDDDDDVLPDAEDDDAINSASPSTSSPAHAVTVAVPASSVPNGEPPIAASAIAATTTIVTSSSTPSPKQYRIEAEEKKPQPQPQPLDDSRRLFQRLWTDEDEIELLQGFLDYTTSRGSTHHNDTALFYDQIKSKLQLDFNKNQLVEKLRRLKKKYRNVVGKISAGKDFSFKSPHDQATFEISRKIWSNNDHNAGRFAVDDSVFDDDDPHLKNPNFNFHTNNNDEIGEKKSNSTPRPRKRSRSQSQSGGIRIEEKRISSQFDNKINSNDCSNNSNLGPLIEETVRSCLSPLFKELLSNAMGVGGRGIGFGLGGLGMNGMAMTAMPLSLGGVGGEGMADERWRKQQILELEVYSKRLELVQDQIRVALEDLRSMRR